MTLRRNQHQANGELQSTVSVKVRIPNQGIVGVGSNEEAGTRSRGTAQRLRELPGAPVCGGNMGIHKVIVNMAKKFDRQNMALFEILVNPSNNKNNGQGHNC